MIDPERFLDHAEAVSRLRQEIQEAVVRGDFIRSVTFGADQDFETCKIVWTVYVRCGQKL